MFISLEPLSGNYIDVYPENVQKVIKNLKNNEHVFLGPECFNAIIHRIDDVFFQKTPGVYPIKKRSGLRSVKELHDGDEVIVYYNHIEKYWTFINVNYSISKKIPRQNIRFPATHVFWQWCSQNHFYKATDSDWVSYSSDDNLLIENAFHDITKEFVQLSIGMKSYKIIFLVDEFGNRSIYAFQKDVNSERRRVVRRSLSNLTSFAIPENETTCALCCEDFKDTTHLPWLKTPCNHVFHCVCFDRVREEKKCPMCRQNI